MTTRTHDGAILQGDPVRRRALLMVVVGLLALLLPLVSPTPAQAVIEEQDFLVDDDPVEWTPHVLDGEVYVLSEIGNRIIVGGSFNQIQNAGGGPVINQPNLFAFNRTTGQIDLGFRPQVNNRVAGIAPAADGQSIYVGGYFTDVNGTGRGRTVLMNATNGSIDLGFRGQANSRVNDVDFVDGRLFVGGNFSLVNGTPRTLVAELNPQTGAVLDSFNHTFQDAYGGANAALSVRKMDVSPDGTRLIAIGNFGTVDGQDLDSIVQFDLASTPSSVFNWRTTRYRQNACFAAFDTYMRDVEIAPDGSYFVVATTGGGVQGSLCDTAARWEMGNTGDNQQPTWVNSTGGDTLWSAGVTGEVVYVGGHQRWLNNPFGRDFAGPGAVSREGLAALDPRNGLPLSWNPGRDRGIGLFDFLSGPEGVFMSADTDRWANYEYHGRLALFPAQGGAPLPDALPGPIPGLLMEANPNQGVTNPGYLYRVNAGGPALPALDNGVDWAADTGTTSPYRNSGSNAATWGVVPTVDASVPSSAPAGLYSSERWDPSGGQEMAWAFPVPTGTEVEVRLYLGNRCTCTQAVGAREFDVRIDGATVLDDLDLSELHGHDVGAMHSFPITSDGLVNIDFGHVTENPLVNGIEIVAPDLLVDDGPPIAMRLTDFDGTTTGTSVNVPGTGWAGVRGSFMLSGELFNGWSNGTMTRRTFDGATFGPAETINLNGLGAAQFPVASLTGATFDPITGRMLYTVEGNSNLFQRGFQPDSGIVGAEDITQQASLPGMSWSQVRGLHVDVASNRLFYSTSDGNLWSVPYTNGRPEGASTLISGPAAGDGLTWGRRGLTVYAGEDVVLPNQPPTAQINADCDGTECTFTTTGSNDPDGEIVSYDWDFGDGATASGTSVSHNFGEGDWDVVLTVTDDDGATGQATEPLSFSGPPEAVIDVSCLGLECEFDGTSSTDFGDPVVSYAWDFGDGGSGTDAVVEYPYDEAGTYTVSLTVTDDEGDTDTATQEVEVSELDDSISWVGSDSQTGQLDQFEVTVPSDVVAGDLLMLFVSSSRPEIGDEPPTGVAGWTRQDTILNRNLTATVWSRVADGSEAGQAVSVSMEGAWTKADVTVAAWRGVDPDNPLLVSEAAAETVDRADHTTPEASVAAEGAWEVSYWTDRTSATTSWTPPSGVVVRHEGHTESGGRASALLADSGGPVAPGPIGGLTATADSSNVQASMWTFALAPSDFVPPDPVPPVAALDISCVGLECQFDGSASDGVDDEIASYAWDFGDGSTSDAAGGPKDFAAEGTYTVELTVTDGQGLTDTTSQEVTIAADPVAAFDVSCDALTCQFDGSASSDAGDPVVSYDWDFDDGGTATIAAPEHTFGAEGTYEVTLTVTDDEGASASVTQDVDASLAPPDPVAPVAAFIFDCDELTCAFDGSASDGVDDAIVSYDWDFDGLGSDTGASPEFTFGAGGTYAVSLTVTDGQGLTDTTSQDVVVAGPEPAGDISWVGSDSSTGRADSFEVTVPADVAAGDLLMVFVSSSIAEIGDEEPTGVPGWSLEDSVVNRNLTATVWSKVADGSEAGEDVSVSMEGVWTKADVTVAAWRGVDPSNPLLVSEVATETVDRADHTTPEASVAVEGAWEVSYWTDRTSATTSWTPPSGVVVRHEGSTDGGGRQSALLADSGGPVAPGPIGGLTATADSSNVQASMWTFALQRLS